MGQLTLASTIHPETVIFVSCRILLLSPFLFAIAGAVCRFMLQHTETRLQIVWFWTAALLFHLLGRRSSAFRPAFLPLLLDCAAATFAILLMKFALEGVPAVVGKMLMAV